MRTPFDFSRFPGYTYTLSHLAVYSTGLRATVCEYVTSAGELLG